MTPNPATNLLAGKYEVLEAPDTCATSGPRRVRHAVLGAEFALTVADAEPAQAALRSVAGLRHEHIAPVAEVFDGPGGLHALESLADGEPLVARLAEGPLAALDALRFARQLADALGHAHAAGVVHGALTSATVRVDRAAGRALVAGLAQAATDPSRATDARADVFALGCVLFEMLEGRPLDTQGEGAIVPRYSRIAPTGVPALVGRAVRRRPADRFQTMAEMMAAIDACLQRLGQQVTPAAAPAVAAANGRPVRRVVPDPALIEDLGEDDTAVGSDEPFAAPAAPGMRMKDLLLAKAARAASRPGPAPEAPRPVVVAEGGRRRGPGRVVAVAGAIVGAMVALTLVLGWPRRQPAASPPVAVIAPAPAPAPLVVPIAVIVPEEETPGGPPLAERPVDDSPADVADARSGFEAAADLPASVAAERNLAPRIAGQQPAAREAVRVSEGQGIDLVVRATDRNRGDELRYTWFVDDVLQKTARGARWRFAAAVGQAGATHTVAVQVADRAGLRAPRAMWRVEIMPRMTEANVHDWLTRLALAYERKDIATLRLFGLVTSDAEASAIRKRVPWFGGYHVATVNPSVHLERQYASVAFDRVESDGGGRVIRSAREAYQLEKQANGFVGLRQR